MIKNAHLPFLHSGYALPNQSYQVEPDALDFEPLIHDFLQQQEPGLPLADLLLEGLDVRRPSHCLGLDDVIVQKNLETDKAVRQPWKPS